MNDDHPDFLDETQAAAVLGAKPQTLRVWAVRRKGPPRIKVGRRIYYRRTALLAWLTAQEIDFALARQSVA